MHTEMTEEVTKKKMAKKEAKKNEKETKKKEKEYAKLASIEECTAPIIHRKLRVQSVTDSYTIKIIKEIQNRTNHRFRITFDTIFSQELLEALYQFIEIGWQIRLRIIQIGDYRNVTDVYFCPAIKRDTESINANKALLESLCMY